MHRITIQYGAPADPTAFDQHYADVHVPLALKVPGWRALPPECRSLDRSEPPYYMVAKLGFETAESLKAGLTSPEMQAAGADVANFATGGVTMYVQEENVILG